MRCQTGFIPVKAPIRDKGLAAHRTSTLSPWETESGVDDGYECERSIFRSGHGRIQQQPHLGFCVMASLASQKVKRRILVQVVDSTGWCRKSGT